MLFYDEEIIRLLMIVEEINDIGARHYYDEELYFPEMTIRLYLDKDPGNAFIVRTLLTFDLKMKKLMRQK